MATTNKAQNSAPTWLNNTYLQTALRSGEGDPSIEVISSEIKPATIAGDNYGSDMYRAVVKLRREGRTEEKSIIIKANKPVSAEFLAKIKSWRDVFLTEIQVFAVAVPAMSNLLSKISTRRYEPFTAKYISSHRGVGNSALVVEDLKAQGFRLASTATGLDMKHCALVLRRIAQFHAASKAAYHRNPSSFDVFLANMYSDEQPPPIEPFFVINVKSCAEEVETWPGFKERFGEKMHRMADTVMADWCRAVTRDDSGFNVLTHGDLWLNNLMFRYSDDTGEVEDVRFVDFQLTHWTSPAVDLQYFLNSSASPEILEKSDLLIQEYYSTLCDTLTLLGHENLQPKLSELKEEFEKKAKLGVITAIVIRSVAFPDRSKICDILKVLAYEEVLHFSDDYKQLIRTLLPIYEKWGWI
ncbi:uncharacterized protein [Periplaneta americana]|uniref:uncharacterized protein n=1 Tax=Periplaneta americana TaxID=6978 RepID=UPI0037E97421